MIEKNPYQGRILRVDLTSGKISKEQFDLEMLRKYVAGNGVNIKIL